MMKRVTNRYLLLVILALIAGGAVLFHYLPPAATWNASPDNVVITSERWGEVSLGEIPDVRIWGDGHIMWLQLSHQGKRQVKEAYLSQAEMSRIVNQLIQSGFFVGHRWPIAEFPSFPTLYVNLREAWHRQEINQQNPALYALVQFLQSGAGQVGRDFVPTTGQLAVYPVETTEFRDRQVEINYQWPEERFGYNLASVLMSRPSSTVTGEELAFAWEIANDPVPLVTSNGQIYWLTVLIPGVTP